jgi:hypothetical protein
MDDHSRRQHIDYSYHSGGSSLNDEGSAASYDNDDDDSSSSGDILLRLERNDPHLTNICLHHQDPYFPENNDIEWFFLGHILGNNTHIADLSILNSFDGEAISTTNERALYAGLEHNRSIQNLHFTGPLPGLFGFVHPSNQFWEENTNLVQLDLNGLELGRREMNTLYSIITTKTKNLISFGITHCWSIDADCFLGEDDGLFSIFLRTLSNMDHSLKRLELQGNTIGFPSLNKLVRTIRRWHPDLEELNLQDNIMGYFSCCALASLLRDPTVCLSCLDLWSCSINDDCALLLADALRHNNSLQFVNLRDNNFTVGGIGWKAFSTLLCNKTSIVETFSSNHTLKCLGVSDDDLLVGPLLSLNLSDDKRAVAMNKVVKFHLGELLAIVGLKLLPNIMTSVGANQKHSCHESCRRDLLSAMFSIVRNTPALFQYVNSNEEGNQDVLDITDGLEKMTFHS